MEKQGKLALVQGLNGCFNKMAVNGTSVALPPFKGEPSAEITPTGATSTLLLICVCPTCDNK